jgi:hypothetical protein
MTSFKFLGAALVFSALLATPASAWVAISEPAAAEAADPTFSIYSGMHGDIYSGMHGDASGLHMSVRPHRGNHTAGVKRFRSR